MENRETWNRLLHLARVAHEATPALQAFCPFPNDVRPQEVQPFAIPAARLLADETLLVSERLGDLRDAFVAAGPLAQWRETYKGTDIGQDFMDRFACYCLIGQGGGFTSRSMAAWVVYMPAHLHYTWHHHPGEEMYMVIAGEAEFMREGHANEVLREGQTVQHASNMSHAMDTHASPVMAYVVWRNGFETAPVLTPARSVVA